jgi:hypothetical protein
LYNYLTPFNIYYNTKDLEFGLQYNRKIILQELKRKLSEDPNGIIINKFIREHPGIVNEIGTLDEDK